MSRKARKLAGLSDTVSGSLGAENLGLSPPFASAPTRPGKHCLYINKGSGRQIAIFATTYAARKYLDILLEDDDVSRIRGVTGEEDTIVTNTGLTVRCSEIDEIIKHKYSSNEEKWEMGEPDATNAMRFRSSGHVQAETSVGSGDNDSKSETSKVVREKKVKTPRPSKEGLISIGDIATELKMEPRDCRAILRDKKIAKPDVGWAWNKEEVDKIKQIIHDNK